MKPKYKRIMLKLSGEGLADGGEEMFSPAIAADLVSQIKAVHNAGTDICLVIGGGNIFRGRSAPKGLPRSVADQMGMMATVMNGLFLQEALKKADLDVRLMSSLDVPKVCESYVYEKAAGYLEKRRIVIFAGGTGNPFFTTDSAATLKAAEMNCDVVLKATQVDGVYDSDPKKNPNAKRYEAVSFDEAIQKELKVMDTTALALARENNIPIVVFAQSERNSLVDVVCGKGNFTVMRKEV
ncbi:MAG: UMP kinase [Lactobacillaceae bacterium]|jgi:uridylate kinase|nr:UMP kinase [Lactobacillaceae bacterium]